MDLVTIFITGLTTGGLSCLAMQGGLLASIVTNQNQIDTEIKNDNNKYVFPVLMFLGAKLISHTIFGFLLGYLGSLITLSLEVRVGFQIFTALFMFATAMNLLNVHPIFRYVVIQPPSFVRRLIKDKAKTKTYFAPALLGALTVFIPCGVTQAMEVLAINSGSPVQGALIMFSFVLGTSPLFAVIGIATTKISENWHTLFTQVASIILIIMSLYFVNGALVAINSPLGISTNSTNNKTRIELVEGQQEVNIQVLNSGYSPNYIQVKENVPVKLTLNSNEVYSCALAFVFREFGINTFLDSTDSQSFEFTPNKKGKFRFSCSMGMYTGIMEVI